MLPSVSSSSDLAQLSDAELVEKIESAWRAYEDIEARRASAWDDFRRYWGRSPERSAGFSLASLFKGHGNVGPLHPSLTLEPTVRAHHAVGEIRDLTDELERRIARRRAQRA